MSSAGGLIRDHNGTWIKGFGMNIGSCSVTMAELWGLFQGLNMAWQSEIRWLQVELDNACVYQMVTTSFLLYNEFTSLIWSIKELLKHDWHVRISHIYRDANYAAEHIANLGTSLPLGLHMFCIPPKNVKPRVSYDVQGVAYPRFISL